MREGGLHCPSCPQVARRPSARSARSLTPYSSCCWAGKRHQDSHRMPGDPVKLARCGEGPQGLGIDPQNGKQWGHQGKAWKCLGFPPLREKGQERGEGSRGELGNEEASSSPSFCVCAHQYLLSSAVGFVCL